MPAWKGRFASPRIITLFYRPNYSESDRAALLLQQAFSISQGNMAEDPFPSEGEAELRKLLPSKIPDFILDLDANGPTAQQSRTIHDSITKSMPEEISSQILRGLAEINDGKPFVMDWFGKTAVAGLNQSKIINLLLKEDDSDDKAPPFSSFWS